MRSKTEKENRKSEMKKYISEAPKPDQPIFDIDESFYKNGGGIFNIAEHYLDLIRKGKR